MRPLAVARERRHLGPGLAQRGDPAGVGASPRRSRYSGASATERDERRARAAAGRRSRRRPGRAGGSALDVAGGEQRIVGERGADPDRRRHRCARQRWTSARLSAPEIHLLVPVAVAVRPSRLRRPTCSVTSGRPVIACLRNAWLSRRAAVGLGAVGERDLDARARAASAGPTPAVFVDGVRRSRRRRGRCRPRRAAGAQGGWRPWWRAGLERHVHRRPGGVVAPGGGVGERGALGVEVAEPGRESPRRSPRRRGRSRRRPAGSG